MTAQHSHRLRRGRLQPAGPLFTPGVRATVADDDGTIVITISRQVEPASTEVGADDSLTVVAVDGEIDYDTARLVQLALCRALDDRTAVCCDLSRVTFFGAAAAGTLLCAQQHAAEVGQRFFLRGVDGISGRVLNIVDPESTVAR